MFNVLVIVEPLRISHIDWFWSVRF